VGHDVVHSPRFWVIESQGDRAQMASAPIDRDANVTGIWEHQNDAEDPTTSAKKRPYPREWRLAHKRKAQLYCGVVDAQ